MRSKVCTMTIFLVFLATAYVLVFVKVQDWTWWGSNQFGLESGVPISIWICMNILFPGSLLLLAGAAICGMWVAASNLCKILRGVKP